MIINIILTNYTLFIVYLFMVFNTDYFPGKIVRFWGRCCMFGAPVLAIVWIWGVL